MLAQAVLMAGTDTTRNQLACSVALFTEHPDQWALLAERPELAGRAVEESMRYLGAVRGTARFAAEDVVYRDVLFPQGTLVATSLAGANRDPEAFDDPDVFDITRERTHGADDLRFGHPLLHGGGAGPGRVAGGAAAAGPAPARARPQRRRGVEAVDLRHLGPGATADALHAARSVRRSAPPTPRPARPASALQRRASGVGLRDLGARADPGPPGLRPWRAARRGAGRAPP